MASGAAHAATESPKDSIVLAVINEAGEEETKSLSYEYVFQLLSKMSERLDRRGRVLTAMITGLIQLCDAAPGYKERVSKLKTPHQWFDMCIKEHHRVLVGRLIQKCYSNESLVASYKDEGDKVSV